METGTTETTAMTAAPKQPDPYNEPLADNGKAMIFVPLIIGGAVVVSIIMLWQAHTQKIRLAEMSQTEIAARNELRDAWTEMRALRPEQALEKTAQAGKLVAALSAARLRPQNADYAELKVGLLLLEAESLFMKDCAKNAAIAEEKFSEALSLMIFSSGEMWQAGLLGRARARYEQGKYAEAIADLDQVMTRNANYGAAYYWRSLAKEKSGDADGALDDARTAKRLDSWPPLRDFMQAACVWTRDILCKPDAAFCPAPEPIGDNRSLIPLLAGQENGENGENIPEPDR